MYLPSILLANIADGHKVWPMYIERLSEEGTASFALEATRGRESGFVPCMSPLLRIRSTLVLQVDQTAVNSPLGLR